VKVLWQFCGTRILLTCEEPEIAALDDLLQAGSIRVVNAKGKTQLAAGQRISPSAHEAGNVFGEKLSKSSGLMQGRPRSITLPRSRLFRFSVDAM
jgi:hypothetical protein